MMGYPATPISLAYVADYEKRIANAETNKADEKFLRNFIEGIADDCPLSLIIEMSKCILAARQAELSVTSQQN